MSPDIAVVVEDVAKVYRRFQHRHQFRTLKSAILTGSLLTDLTPEETFTALDGVSFEVPKGTMFGVIGENGSGKSTLLKLLAGITKPTRGTVRVRGRVSALIELGAGFHPEITGRENVAINGIMLGLTRHEIQERFDEIVAFAELERFIDAPVKTYSSGMYMRLGFAVAVHADPEVLLVDEVLAVGDEAFSRKCLDKIGEFRRRGKTIFFVSHSLGLVEKMCDDVLWLRKGRMVDRGDPKRVVDAYLTYVAGGEEALLRAQAAPADPGAGGYREGRWGSREVEITQVRLLDDRCHERHVFVPGESLSVELDVHAASTVDDFVFGIGIFTSEGVSVYGTNTNLEDYGPERLDGRAKVRFAIDRLDLVEGSYLLDIAAHKKDGTPYDYHRGLYAFRVKSHIKDVGLYRPTHHWAFEGGVQLRPPRPRAELDLHDAFSGNVGRPREAAWDLATAHSQRQAWRDAGLSVVLTNGCFDLLHAGHVNLLESARAQGDRLIVAINSDGSVHGLKGPSRPVLPEAERAETLMAMECVDGVVIFDEPTPADVIRSLVPDVLVKGADWGEDAIVGRETVEAHGGRVVRVPLLPGHSTTMLIDRIRRT
jgi:rfaE bifunctional protein nucleotidyltransferase chain/domain